MANGISHASKANMKGFLYAIFEDNDAQQRVKGANESDIISMYETSENAQQQRDNLPEHVQYQSLFDRLKEMAGRGQTLGELKAGGDACCGGPAPAPESHEHILADYMPRLNETIFELIQDDTHLQQGVAIINGANVEVHAFKTITNICNFAKSCLGTGCLPHNDVAIEGGVQGLAPN